MKRMMMFLVLLGISLLINDVYADPLPLKGSLSGVVRDGKTGQPVQGVSILIADIRVGTSTNAHGEYTISNINDGYHLVEVSHIGYNTIAENILIQGETRKDFVISESVIENNAVIITGMMKATQLKKVPFQVSVIREEELMQKAGSNIIDAIASKAGVSSFSTGPAIAKPMIRGLGYNRVLTIHDGVRQEGQQWGDEHGIEIDESSVNKIEILKGPASLVYGSDAMAGVINIISNVPVPSNTLKINAGANYQSNNRLRNVYGNLAGNTHGFNWRLYGSGKAAADYQNRNDGYVFNSKFNEGSFGGYAGYNGAWGFSHVLLSNYDLKAGLVEGERDGLGRFIKPVAGGGFATANESDFKIISPGIPYQHIRHFKLATDNSFKIGKNRLTLNVGWQRNQREEFGNPDAPGERGLYFDLKTTTYTAQFHFRENKGWKPSIGINGMHQVNANKGIEQLIPDYQLDDIGGYFFLQKEFANITVSGGARYDSRQVNINSLMDAGMIKSPGFKKEFSNFSGSIGLAYQPVKSVNLKLNIARAFRAPGIAELASNGAHEGTIRYEYGEKGLKSEISTQADAGIEYTAEHFSLNLAGYFNNFNNFIFYRKLVSVNGGDSIINNNGANLTAFQFSQQAAYLAGFELTFDIHPHPLDWLHLQNSFSLVSGKLKEQMEGSSNLPFIPAPKLQTELKADFKKPFPHSRNAYVKLEIEHNFKQTHPFTAYNTETATPAYTLVNAGMGTDLVNKNGTTLFTISLYGGNLADIAYQNHLSRLKYAPLNPVNGKTGVFNMGRNLSIRINIPLSFTLNK